MKFMKDIIRLPGTFLPVFITALLSVFLVLVSTSLKLSCEDALAVLSDEYEVEMSVTAKESYEKVEDKNGGYSVKNTNPRMLDRAVLDAVEELDSVTDISYVTNYYDLPLSYFCTEDELRVISDAVKNGEDFTGTTESYSRGGMVNSALTFIACTDEKLKAKVFSIADYEITYSDGCSFGDGIILPKVLYDMYASPRALVFGWYKHERVLPQIFDESGEVTIPPEFAQSIENYKNGAEPPLLVVPVAGYYDGDSKIVLTTPEIWEAIYAASSYYSSLSVAGSDPVDTVGLLELSATLDSGASAVPAAKSLMTGIADPEYYLITVDDYDYKFACAQISGILKFTDVLCAVSVIFGILTVALAVHYSVGKRRREAYTLRTLGVSEKRIVGTFGAENALIIVLAVLLGVIAGELLGGRICELVESMSARSAASAAESLSQIAQMMQNSDAIVAQLKSAADAYLSSEATISYAVPASVYLQIALVCAALVLYALIQSFIITKRSLMKRGSDS